MTGCVSLTLVCAALAGAQTPPPAAQMTAQPMAVETRPATTTFLGDTGLWFVPTAEILPDRRGSVSGYRTNWDREQGFTDVSHFLVTFGVGLRDRVELFGSFRLDTRIDRDVRPIFLTNPRGGGMVNEYPLVRDGWSGDNIGDLLIGAKFNLASEHRQQALAAALRAIVKLPTGDDEAGVSSGKADFLVDAIVSKEVNQRVEVAGFGGFIVRGDPDGIDVSHGLRYGFGLGFPSRSQLRVTAELNGEIYFDELFASRRLTAFDGSVSPTSSDVRSPLDGILGLTWQSRKGVFAGAGLSYNFRHSSREKFGPYENEFGDKVGWQFRIGYHPGVRVYVAPPPPPPPPPAPPVNQPPTVKARCEPCVVEACSGQTSTVTADARDPDGDTLTYKWSAPTGQLATPAERQSIWKPPCQEGPVPVTVTVDDGKGGTASDTVTIQVVKPAVKEYVFEDVHFDFDRYTLRPEAARVLDEAVKALGESKTLTLEIEGHTCNIGTAEYNLALGERRAHAVRDYLTGRGVSTERLRTVSYGEERPKHDNAREETRRLNRRAALVVRVK